MDELQVRNNNRQLPSTPDDLYKISVVGREQLNAMRAGIRALDKIEAISEDDIETIAKKREERLKEAQLLSEWILQAEIRLGELLSQLPQTPGKRSDLGPGNTGMTRSKKEILKELGISRQLCATFERLAQHPEIVSAVQQKAVEAGEIMTRTAVLVEIKAQQRPYIAHNSGDSEWMSPSHLVECARKVMGKIDLDPCSCPKANLTVKADMYYTKISDGLQQAWYGHV